jgi:hypothetical protein
MDESLRHQRDTSLGQLDALIRRGRHLKDSRSPDATRAWQQECAAAVNQLSGGSKAHWLARAYSGAFLVRSADGGTVLEADATEIVDRIIGVLEQGVLSLGRMDEVVVSSTAPQRPRRFEFVHDAELRPVLERAFDDSREALERGESGLALILACSVIDALLTDALDHARAASPDPDADAATAADWSFDARIVAAEEAGLIRGGCNRLPPVARTYRSLTDANGQLRTDAAVSERDARIAGPDPA